MAATESETRARTRRAVLDAALQALAADPKATLADIATAAGVSRTTVHRYFPERSDVIDAVTQEIVSRVLEATDRAGLDRGPVPEAIARVVREYFGLGDVLTVMFSGTIPLEDEVWEGEAERLAATVVDAVERGQREGTVDPELPAAWVEQLVWAQLYSSWSYARAADVPRHEALDVCLRGIQKVLAP